jgi:hypothetical protein
MQYKKLKTSSRLDEEKDLQTSLSKIVIVS